MAQLPCLLHIRLLLQNAGAQEDWPKLHLQSDAWIHISHMIQSNLNTIIVFLRKVPLRCILILSEKKKEITIWDREQNMVKFTTRCSRPLRRLFDFRIRTKQGVFSSIWGKIWSLLKSHFNLLSWLWSSNTNLMQRLQSEHTKTFY